MKKFKILENKNKIELKKPNFNCDDVLCKELENLTMFNELNRTFFCIYNGKPRSGKTSLLFSMLKNPKLFKRKFHNIMCVMPSNSRASMKDFPELTSDKMYEELNQDSIDDILEKLQEYTQNKEKTLLILDDVASQLKSSTYLQKQLCHLIFNMRHFKCYIALAIQSYLTIPRHMRKCITHMFLFKPSKTEMHIIAEELFEMDKKDAMNLLKLYEKPHDYLFLCVQSQNMYRNQDKISINDIDE